MGRAGGSGGHRSGGGMHSSGGHRSGSSSFSSGGGRSRSSSSGMSSRPSGGFGRPRGGFGSRPRSGFGYHSSPPPRPHGGFRLSAPPPPSSRGFGYSTSPLGHRSGIGCSSILAIPIIILGIIIFCLTASSSCSSGSYSEPFTSASIVSGVNSQVSYATSRGTYFEDNLEMSLSSSTFDSNMKMFKDQTGINPFVYTCSLVNGSTNPSDSDLDAVYNKLGLKDSVLLIYQEYNDNYGVWVYIDDSISEEQFPTACIDAMENYIVSNYEGSMSNAELLSGAFIVTLDIIN